ncbi:hypothetical protein OG594_18905 [Streptomyces sp. NBC_01214]|uniref:hypothetical protein n=1 Tax=Streptomyces sp. NBC_01214 TaxID=2903777 RepID=UPI00225A6B2D|nr:hypothetical protein [Streptomyces sp. NBC_01214]MCX4803694.1 hypothetical protein [Streptomyces sp. NBC_01214]
MSLPARPNGWQNNRPALHPAAGRHPLLGCAARGGDQGADGQGEYAGGRTRIRA